MNKLHYLNGKTAHGFAGIYTARMVLRAVLGLLGLFLPIFLYELFDLQIQYVIYYYMIGHFLYATFVAWGCKYLNRVGLRRSLIISVIWGALYYVIIFLLSRDSAVISMASVKLWWLLGLSLLFITLFRMMYWVPLHTDIAKFTNKKNRAQQLSVMEATSIFLGAVMPLLAGWIVTNYSFDFLFLLVIIIYLVALIPLTTLPKTNEKFSWSYWQTWHELLSKKRRKAVLAYMGDGAESVVSVIVWPIFIYELLQGNYFQIGALSAVIVVVTVFLQLLVGKWTDRLNKEKMFRLSSILYAIGWIIKMFIFTAFQIFIASTYHGITRLFTRTSFDTMFYEDSADQGHYVDEYTVIHEMAIQYGKFLMLILVLFLLIFISMPWTFILAATASLFMNFLTYEQAKR